MQITNFPRPNLQVLRRGSTAMLAIAAIWLLAACGQADTGTESQSATPTPTAQTPSSSPSPSESPSPSPKPVEASKNLDAIKVTGEPGKEPKVSFKAPWAVDKTRSKVLSEGKGATVAENGTVEVNYYGVNGRTEKKFDDSFSRGEPIKFSLAQVVPGFRIGLTGQKVGSRVLIAMPGKDGYDSSGGSPQAGIEVGDTLVFVVDILSTTLTEPAGDVQPAKAGMPTVSDSLTDPKVSIPDADPPTSLESAVLIQGKGPKVTEADAVTVRYSATSWASGKVVDSNFGKAAETGPLTSLIAGWQEGLKDKTVGSRVLLVVPPALAYPDGNESPKIDKGETLVYVVDILYTQPAQ